MGLEWLLNMGQCVTEADERESEGAVEAGRLLRHFNGRLRDSRVYVVT